MVLRLLANLGEGAAPPLPTAQGEGKGAGSQDALADAGDSQAPPPLAPPRPIGLAIGAKIPEEPEPVREPLRGRCDWYDIGYCRLTDDRPSCPGYAPDGAGRCRRWSREVVRVRDDYNFTLVTFSSLYRVLEILSKREGPMKRGEIDRAVREKGSRRVTQYLSHLRDLGLVHQRLKFAGRGGIQGYYSITPRGREALKMIRGLVEILERDPGEPVLMIAPRGSQGGPVRASRV